MSWDEEECDRRMKAIGQNGNNGEHYEFVSPDTNVEGVRKKLLDRSKVGLAKYGVTTDREDLDLVAWLTHLQEELMDASVYIQATLKRIKDGRD